jgi:hypothetical protein
MIKKDESKEVSFKIRPKGLLLGGISNLIE